jgi:hypothetical protein
MATAALIGLPYLSAAQSYPSSAGQAQSSPSSQSTSSDQNSPRFHLDAAKKALDGIATLSLSGDSARQVSEIKTSFTNLYNDYTRSTAGSMGSQTPPTSPPPAGTSGSLSVPASDWRTEYTQISQALDRLNVPAASSQGGMSGGAGATGTSGSTGGMSGMSSSTTLEPDLKKKLTDFRMHLDKFNELAGQLGAGGSSR